VHLVGRYALGVTWADNHSSIYPFARLRLDDPAREPAAASAGEVSVTEAMGWPRDIKKEPAALRVTWSDGHVSVYPFPVLRGLCKCAGCTGGH
jgi:DUF971 family protein